MKKFKTILELLKQPSAIQLKRVVAAVFYIKGNYNDVPKLFV